MRRFAVVLLAIVLVGCESSGGGFEEPGEDTYSSPAPDIVFASEGVGPTPSSDVPGSGPDASAGKPDGQRLPDGAPSPDVPGRVDAGPEDDTRPPGPDPGQLGAACESNGDCDCGYCVPSDIGHVCTCPCIDDCPEGWRCRAVDVGGADVPFICMPSLELICETAGECEAGIEEREPCGNCGERSRSCDERCQWSAWSACSGEGVCPVGAQETESCGHCATRSRTCDAECLWSEWSACADGGVCAPGDTQTEACGFCGERSKSCTDDCLWSEWGACTAQGVCAAGEVDVRACGSCGSQTSVCGADCRWGAWAGCVGEGVCTPGEANTEPCGACGERTQTCTDACTWSQWSACSGEGGCSPGEVDTQPCGDCGVTTRVCRGDCRWGPAGLCVGEGQCTPGETEEEPCGDCGTRSRQCTAGCGWTPWSSCLGEGECGAGDLRELPCGDCGTASQFCSASCEWVTGPCEDEGPCGPGDTASCENCGTKVCTSGCVWGACAIGAVDTYEENDSEGDAYTLSGIGDSDGDASFLLANVNPSSDDDWYEVHVSDDTGSQIDPWVTLSAVPSGQTYRVCVDFVCDQNGNPPSRACASVNGGSSATIELDVSGCDDNCGMFCYDNSGTMVIQVEPVTPGSCSSYRLDYGA